MNDEQIKNELKVRVDAAHKEITAVLAKYELALIAEDQLTPNTKVNVDIAFVDRKKYPTAELAQPEVSKVPAAV